MLAAAGTGAVSFPKAGEGTKRGGLTPGGGVMEGLKVLPTDVVPLTGRVALEAAGAAA